MRMSGTPINDPTPKILVPLTRAVDMNKSSKRTTRRDAGCFRRSVILIPMNLESDSKDRFPLVFG